MVLGSSLLTISWRLSKNKSEHADALSGKDKEINQLRAEISQLRAEHNLSQAHAQKAFGARSEVLSLLDDFAPQIKARDAPSKFAELRQRVADTLPLERSVDVFDSFIDESMTAAVSAVPSATAAKTQQSAQPAKGFSGMV